jgi:integrase
VIRHSIKRLRTPKKGESKFQLRLTTGHGKDTKKLTRRFNSREEAKQFIEDEEKRILEENKIKAELRLLGLSAEDVRTWDTELAYYESNKLPLLSNAWRQTVEAFAREVNPFLAGKGVYTEINHQLVDVISKFLQTARPLIGKNGEAVRMKPPDSLKTLSLKISWIQSVLNYSVEKQRIKYSPIVSFKKTKAPESEIEFWERAEAEDFFKCLNDGVIDTPNEHDLIAMYLTHLSCALRTGELFALKPKCIKRSISQLYISEQIDKVTGEIAVLKGKKARSVPLNGDILRELDAIIKRDGIKSDELIFRFRDHAFERKHYYSTFTRRVSNWGGRSITPHGLRHTGATLMLLSGVDIRTLQKILGHTELKTTERYAHVLNSQITEAAQFSIRSVKRIEAPK